MQVFEYIIPSELVMLLPKNTVPFEVWTMIHGHSKRSDDRIVIFGYNNDGNEGFYLHSVFDKISSVSTSFHGPPYITTTGRTIYLSSFAASILKLGPRTKGDEFSPIPRYP